MTKNIKTRIELTIEPQGNGMYNLYIQTNERRLIIGAYPDMESALKAKEKSYKMLEVELPKKGLQVHRTKPIKLPLKKEMQAAAMALSPERASAFRENLIMIGYSLHILTDSFDELCSFFGAVLNESVRNHYRNAEKQITALMDAVYQSEIMGDTAGFMDVHTAAMAIKERLQVILTYCLEEEWRIKEIEKAIDNVTPDEWVEKQRQTIGNEIRQSLEKYGLKTEKR